MTLISDRYKVLGAEIASLVLTMGVARFAYTPLLPLMQQQADLGVAEAGWLAAINYAGYLSGALIASVISDVVLKDRLYRVGMVMAVLTTAMMGMTTNPTIWAVSRYLAGLSTTAGMLLGTGLILNWLIRHDERSELGIHFSGVGLGIAGSAAAVALMNCWHFDWHEQWYVFTAIGCVLLLPAWAWLPAPDRSTVTRAGTVMRDAPPSPSFLRIFMAAYFCAGIGYVVSTTFIVAIIDHLPGLGGDGTLVFLVIGLAAVPGCVIWDLVARRAGEINALIICAVLQIAGILLSALDKGLFLALLGAVLFGATVVGMVSSRAHHGRALLPDASGQDDGQDDLLVRHSAGDRASHHRFVGSPFRRLSVRTLSSRRGDGCRRFAPRDAAELRCNHAEEHWGEGHVVGAPCPTQLSHSRRASE